MGKEQCICLLTAHDVKPTANRIVIAEALAAADCPMSVKELEYSILSIDKSNIFRTLMLFKAHHLVHVIEDGNGSVKYELPDISLPADYELRSINCVVKGLCPKCRKQ